MKRKAVKMAKQQVYHLIQCVHLLWQMEWSIQAVFNAMDDKLDDKMDDKMDAHCLGDAQIVLEFQWRIIEIH